MDAPMPQRQQTGRSYRATMARKQPSCLHLVGNLGPAEILAGTEMTPCPPPVDTPVVAMQVQLSRSCNQNSSDLASMVSASPVQPFFSARCNIYISHLCHDASPSVCLSVTEVHWRIIANLGFKFRSHFTANWPPCCWRAPCCLRANHLAPC